MSRATRRCKRWERELRAWVLESSRELALDLYYGRARPLSSYGTGVSLGRGEILYREVCARYWTLGQPTELVDNLGRTRFVLPVWRDWGWCQTVLTSHRLVARLAADGGRLIRTGGRASVACRSTSRGTSSLWTTARATGAARTEDLQSPSSPSPRWERSTGCLLW